MQMDLYDAKGDPASRLRQRKHALLRQFQIPVDGLPGSLAQTRRRCGKAACHCAGGEGHPLWSLTFMVGGKKRVERIPDAWVEQIRPLVAQGRACKEAVADVLAANAQLLALRRTQSAKQAKKRSGTR